MARGGTNHRYYRSILLYAGGNSHMSGVAGEYRDFLRTEHAESFAAITFEKFFSLIEEHAESSEAKDWATWLKQRYIPAEAPASRNERRME